MRLWTPAKAPEKETPDRSIGADKAPDAFRTISEVAEEMDLPQHVLRFWETRFTQIRPLKRGGGRRYYRPDDIDLLRGIKHLLYGEGYTIKGVQRILKSNGLKFVQTIWRDPDAVLPPQDGWSAEGPDTDSADESFETPPWEEARAPIVSPVNPVPASPASATPARVVPAPQPAAPVVLAREAGGRALFGDDLPGSLNDAERIEPSFTEKSFAEVKAGNSLPDLRAAPSGFQPGPRLTLHSIEEAPLEGGFSRDLDQVEFVEFGLDASAGPVETLYPRMDIAPAAPLSAPALSSLDRTATRLSKDDVRRLQATLFELIECERMLQLVR